MRGRGFLLFICTLISISFFSIQLSYAQEIDMDAVKADEEFRWGVDAFHSGLFNKAVLSFEKSLSLKPDNPLTREWLGRAYFRSGFVEPALTLWKGLIEEGRATGVIQNRVEILEARRGLVDEVTGKEKRYIKAHGITGIEGEITLFRRPASLSLGGDGFTYVAAFGSNEVLQMDVNGGIQRRFRGGFDGFDHPFDVRKTEGDRYYISEFEGDRVAVTDANGFVRFHIGGTGTGDGKLLGPQYLALDDSGYLYVTDWGNRRVCKYDDEGNFILSFRGRPGSEQFLGPSGVLVLNNRVYVADSLRKHIQVFDESGNYLDTLGEGMFHGPEGLAMYAEGMLLVADTDRVVSFDPRKEVVTTLYSSGEGDSKIMKAELHDNGELIVSNFNNNSVSILTGVSDMYSGFSVQIDSVLSEDFPLIKAAVNVKDRFGSPITGLRSVNFRLTEFGQSVEEYEFLGAVGASNTADITILLDKSPRMARYILDGREAVASIIESGGEGLLSRVVSAGENPVKESSVSGAASEKIASVNETGLSPDWSFDRGLRFAATELVPIKNKRAVVFVTPGTLGDTGFTTYGLLETAEYLKNNGITFYCVTLTAGEIDDELEYLCRKTGGAAYYLYNPKGISPLVEGILDQPSGLYLFQYVSGRETDFGRRYLEIEAEAALFNRSGRDEAGYFAPLEF